MKASRNSRHTRYTDAMYFCFVRTRRYINAITYHGMQTLILIERLFHISCVNTSTIITLLFYSRVLSQLERTQCIRLKHAGYINCLSIVYRSIGLNNIG